MYFACPAARRFAAVAVSDHPRRLPRFFHLGGPVEETGRLRYIDGCTDSLLIRP